MWVLKVKVISLPYIFQVLFVLCFTWPRYQVSVYRTIGPLVYPFAVEIGCNNGSSFLCGDAKCIPKSRVCDGTPDCVSGEDENWCMVPETCQQWWSVGYQTSGIYKVCMYQKIITVFALLVHLLQ